MNAKNDDGDTPLHFAASKGSAEIVALLLANKAKVDEPDAEGMTALHRAARGGHAAAIEVLIANGATVNTKNKAGLTPLELADADAVEVLRKHGAQSAVKLGALSDDAANGNLEAVKQHLKAGSDVNGKDNLGRTPLYRAAYNGHKEIVVLLLENKADTNARDANGWAPLHGSAYKGHVEIVAALIAAKAEVNAKDTDGDTPLDWAKTNRKCELLQKTAKTEPTSRRPAINPPQRKSFTLPSRATRLESRRESTPNCNNPVRSQALRKKDSPRFSTAKTSPVGRASVGRPPIGSPRMPSFPARGKRGPNGSPLKRNFQISTSDWNTKSRPMATAACSSAHQKKATRG